MTYGRVRRALLPVAAMAMAAAVALPASPASAATVLATWDMDESPGSTTMIDSSGNGRHGTIGSKVQVGEFIQGSTGYRFKTGENVQDHERLVLVDDSQGLDPRANDYRVTVRLLTGAGDQNVAQKGQATAGGGYFKMDIVKGIPICTFKGSEGRKAIGWGRTIWDRTWHTVTCTRTSSGVSISVDDQTPRRISGVTGTIDNKAPFSIGGKPFCDPPEIGCDYFIGVIDQVRVETL